MDATSTDGADRIGGNVRRRWTWRGWLLWGAVGGVCALLAVGLLMPTTRGLPRSVIHGIYCETNVERIAKAMLRYSEVHGSLPPAFTRGPDGKPLHSWRTLVLPYLGEEKLFSTIDLSKPWDDPANARARRSMPAIYACRGSWARAGRTTYMVVVAPDSCFRADGPVSLSDLKDAGRRTIVVVDFPWRRAVDWMAPRDTDMESWLALGKEDGLNHPGFNAGELDGSSKVFRLENLSHEQRRALITVTDDDPADRR